MRTILTVNHETRIIQSVKIQRFNGTYLNLENITEIEATKLLQIPGKFERYTRRYQILK